MKKYYLLIIVSFLFSVLSAQNIKSMEFHNQEITDILLVLAESSGVSIIPDETVTGKASFYFAESTIEEALNNFLNTYKYYYEKSGKIIRVSKIKTDYNKDTQTASIKTDSVAIETIFRNLSGHIGKTILFDTLPLTNISLDIDNLPIKEILTICIRKLPDYEVEDNDSYFYIKKISAINNNKKGEDKIEPLIKEGSRYNLNLEKGRFLEVITKLFALEGLEYSIFVQSDTQLENLYFSNKSFESLLRLILEHANADYVIKDNIYYLIDLQKRGVAGKLKSTEIIHLKWISVNDLQALLPTELAASSVLRIDKNSNSILLTGTNEEVYPIKNFIKQMDVCDSGTEYKRIDLKYLNPKDLITLLPKNNQNQAVIIPDSNSILVSGTSETLKQLCEFIDIIDVKKSGTPIRLKYISTETLIKNLPPSISKEMVVDSGYPNLLFYTGTEENLKLFTHELSLIDKPQPQIKYQLLVIQYTKGKSQTIKPSLTVSPNADTSSFLFGGELSNVMGLSFDIISTFGYQFAVNLNTQIGENTANVFTDTTLTGISGQDIKFQNTDTYRYIEYEYDTVSGTTARTSSTQQITSGLLVNLNGWVSGDNMITMTVNATVSKQNTDSGTKTSSSLTTLPSTSERVVTTQVRTMSGEPVIISGLIKEDDSETENRTPFLGKVPWLRKLFNHTTKAKDKTEIVIYIVPHLVQEYSKADTDALNIEHYYNSFVRVN